MFIENKQYRTDLIDINRLRYLLFTNFYGKMEYIQKLTEIINKNIDCLGIDYCSRNYTFTVKIKKTAMRKQHKFRHNPGFYYQIIPNIFSEFIKMNEQDVISVLGTVYDDPYTVVQYLYNNPMMLCNLCYVSCISDNIIFIKL